MASSGVAGDDAYPTKMPTCDVSLRPVIEEIPAFLRFAVGQLCQAPDNWQGKAKGK
jgi:hypothetical protein